MQQYIQPEPIFQNGRIAFDIVLSLGRLWPLLSPWVCMAKYRRLRELLLTVLSLSFQQISYHLGIRLRTSEMNFLRPAFCSFSWSWRFWFLFFLWELPFRILFSFGFRQYNTAILGVQTHQSPSTAETWLYLPDTLDIASSHQSILSQSATRHTNYLPLLLLAAIWWVDWVKQTSSVIRSNSFVSAITRIYSYQSTSQLSRFLPLNENSRASG